MISALVSRLIILMFGVLHPAYASYKAVRTKHIKEYVKWMMYWIVFAFFTFFESFTDIFLSWLPFYYEVKVVIVLWLLSPATHGSSTLYRKFVHPALERREEEIDKYLNEAKERGYSAVLQLGSKGVNYATNVIMQTALKTFRGVDANGLPRLMTSQSDYGIYERGDRSSDAADGPDHLHGRDSIHRSSSLNTVTGTMEIYEELEEDVYQYGDDDQYMATAARIREPPVRKTRAKTAASAAATTKATAKSTKTGSEPLRGRRKRDPTPDIDVGY